MVIGHKIFHPIVSTIFWVDPYSSGMLPLLDAAYIEKQLLFARRRSQTNCFFFPSHLLFNFELECLISLKRRNFLLLLLFVGICHFRNTQRNCSAQVFSLSLSTSDSKKVPFLILPVTKHKQTHHKKMFYCK